MPPSEHLTEREDTVSLDSVDDPTLVLSRLVEFLPERDVGSLTEEVLVCRKRDRGGEEFVESEYRKWKRREGRDDRKRGRRRRSVDVDL